MNSIFLEKLNEKQKEAVLTSEGPLLILAGAGSGKTRVIVNRIAYLIGELNVLPSQILAITFTNKAANEMRERIGEMLSMDARGMQVSTFHSFCVRILRAYAPLLGYDTNFTIYDSDDQKALVKNVCARLNIDTKKFKEKMFMTQISHAKDELTGPDRFEMNASDYYEKRVAQVYSEYQKELKKNNAFDFDDLIVKVVELFNKHPEVLDVYQERFRYISVDEYQDTNTAQFEMVSLLASKYRNLCVVGDDDQSIYKFRGANIGNILNFEKVFPEAKVIRLEQNYRSTKNILDAANAVIKNNEERKDKSLWTAGEDGARIKLMHVDNTYVEAERVASEIEKLISCGTSYNDCACLYRTNAQSRVLEEAFIRENIPYKIVGGVNFYQRKEIKDVLAYLKTIDNAADDIAVRRIINVPKRGIGKSTVDQVQKLADFRGISFYTAADTGVSEGLFEKNTAKLKIFTDLIDSLKDVSLQVDSGGISLREFMEILLEETGYVRDLQAEGTDEAQTRIENIEELINKAAIYENGTEAVTLGGFLEEVSLVVDIDSWDRDEDYVSLITVHSAKGLEFTNVFLCGMEDGLFPMNAAICSDDPTDLEEERRLAYVAITRAKKRLFLSAVRSRMVRGEVMASSLSRFVKEIPPLLIEADKRNIYAPEKKTVYNSGYFDGEAPYKGSEHLGVNPYKQYASRGSSSSSGGKARDKNISAAKNFESANTGKGLDYKEGDTVLHSKFGEGVVTDIVSGGRDFEVTVDFKDFGVKKMFAGFAKLRKI